MTVTPVTMIVGHDDGIDEKALRELIERMGTMFEGTPLGLIHSALMHQLVQCVLINCSSQEEFRDRWVFTTHELVEIAAVNCENLKSRSDPEH